MNHHRRFSFALAAVLALPLSSAVAQAPPTASVVEFRLEWRNAGRAVHASQLMANHHNHGHAGNGSSHELVFDPRGGRELWVSGQAYDQIARVGPDGSATYYATPPGSAPHGMVFDAGGRLWVTFEGLGSVARVDARGQVVQRIDVRLFARDAPAPINTHPHGLALGPDGRTLWFTGKLTNTVGRIDPGGQVTHFVLPTVGAVPIYMAAGPDGNMWCTELVGNRIARITPQGEVTEFPIPTLNSRPIAIVPGPDGRSMWFSQEAGKQVARIDMAGRITEYPVPMTQDNAILGGLAFDRDGHLWTQAYVNPQAGGRSGDDFVIRIDKAIGSAAPGDLSGVALSYFRVPSRGSVMHRIVQGAEGQIWFTELALDRLGRLTLARP